MPVQHKHILIQARITLLRTEEGGRRSGLGGSSHDWPNHRFDGTTGDRTWMGRITLPEGQRLNPGEDAMCDVTFLDDGQLRSELWIGRRWRIWEGPRLVAWGEIIAIAGEAAV